MARSGLFAVCHREATTLTVKSNSTIKLITVYTCSTSQRDALRDDQCTDGARFVAFVDTFVATRVWDCRPAATLFHSARRNARLHKILAHQFIETDYSIWMDANVELKVPALRLIEDYLQDSDLAVFRHRVRGCTYDEAARCRELRLDSPQVIDEQISRYAATGFARGLGLPETTVLIRRHNDSVRRFNESWWSQLCRHSVRDQISFMFAAAASDLSVRFITPTKFDHPYFSMSVRPPGIEAIVEAA